jgi:hypothetical protein
MNDRQAIIFGLTGQLVEFYPWREWSSGPPSAAATYRVWRGAEGNDSDPVSGMSGTATMDTFSQALDASAGPSQANRRKIPLGTTTGVTVGRWYITENVGGQRELVKVTKVVDADHVEVEHELVFEYVSGTSYLKGFRQTFVVNADWVADVSELNEPEFPFRVEWAYTVASVARRSWTYLDLVRKARGHSVSPASMLQIHPDIGAQLPNGATLDTYIEAGWKRLQGDFDSRSIDVNSIAEGPNLDRLLERATLLVLGEDGIVPPHRDIEAVVRERFSSYSRLFESMTGGELKLRMADKSGAITDDPDNDLWFRS